jgi:DNA-binding protein H-NS
MTEALIKPRFAPPLGPDDLPSQLITTEHSRLAEHMIAAYRSMRAEIVKTYTEMLTPLNKKRNVILGWKRDDLHDIDDVVEQASALLSDYRIRAARAREVEAEAVLAKAQAEAQRQQEEDATFLETAADLAADADLSDVLAAQAKEVRQAPPPLVAVIDDTQPEPPRTDSPIVERKSYKADCHDLMLLVRAVADGRVSPQALLPNQAWLNAQAGALRDEFALPGCELLIKSSFARKAGRL